MSHTYKLGRTCRNCSEVRKTENGHYYCVYSQWIGGYSIIRNTRALALKCPDFQNEKLNQGEWKNEEVFYKHPMKFCPKNPRNYLVQP